MIVVFGSLNLDLIAWVDSLPQPGQTLAANAFKTEPGGKGANQAVAAARDGARVAMAGCVGDDAFAPAVLTHLRAAGVDLAALKHVPGVTGCALINADATGRNSIVIHDGANGAATADQVPDAWLSPETTLVLQMEVPPLQIANLVRQARQRGCRIVLNLAPAGALPEETLRALDWLVVNEDEAEWLAARFQCKSAAGTLHARLCAGVVRTLGAQGLEAVWPGGACQLPAHRIEVVDSTAAGDCFTGVFAAALDRGLPVNEALARGNAAAALACTRKGSQGSLPASAEIDATLASRGSTVRLL